MNMLACLFLIQGRMNCLNSSIAPGKYHPWIAVLTTTAKPVAVVTKLVGSDKKLNALWR
jgi:hypothetical protein